jgi:catechol 2,3-dioxygenase-like lactoylglutathione lyase family enzyme
VLRKIAFVTYPVKNVARAREFYEDLLGLQLGLHGNHGDKWWLEYDLPGGGCLALSNFEGEPSASAGGRVAFEVDDLDALMAKLAAQGVVFSSGVIHGPRCRMAVCLDSEGNSLLLHQLNAG